MGLMPRVALAFALSLVAAGAVQQIMMAVAQVPDPLDALPPLAAVVAIVPVVFGIAVRRNAAAANVAAVRLAVMAVVAAGGIMIGIADRSPGVGGDILYGLAQVTDTYFLLPSAIAVPIHWLVLRREVRNVPQ